MCVYVWLIESRSLHRVEQIKLGSDFGPVCVEFLPNSCIHLPAASRHTGTVLESRALHRVCVCICMHVEASFVCMYVCMYV